MLFRSVGSGRRVSAGPERDQFWTDAAAHGNDADGLGEHVSGRGAGWAFLFTEFADVVCDTGDAGALLCWKPVELGTADQGGTQSSFGGYIQPAVPGRDSGPGERGSAAFEFVPSAGAGRIIAATCLWDACRMDA